jgi:hypothetical protein
VVVVNSPFSDEVCTIRGEFAGMSTNSNGDKKLQLYLDRPSRHEAEILADTAGYILEFRVYRKPRLRAAAAYNTLDLPDAEIP